MDAILTVAALTVILYGLQWFARTAGPGPVSALYFVLPAALTAYWLRVNDFGPFPWIKVYSVLFCACYGSVLRFTALGNRRSARGAVTVLLGLNILEAATLGIIEGGLANVLNAGAALALIAALPRSAHAVRVIEADQRDLCLDIPRVWVAGYTVWNWAFVYLNYPQYTGHHTAVLGAALVVGVIDPTRWVQARAYTLGGYFIAVTTFGPYLRGRLDTSEWTDPQLGLIATVLALVLAAVCLGQWAVGREDRRVKCGCGCVLSRGAATDCSQGWSESSSATPGTAP
jgi:hypothetical protein